MKPASIAVTFGLLYLTACLYAQDSTPKPASAPVVPAAQVAPAAQGQAAAVPVPTQVPSQPGTAPAEPMPAGAPQPATGAPGTSADIEPNYVLGPDDVINVNVFKDPTLSGSLIVRPDGKISVNLLGDLTAAGLTPMALAASIRDSLKKFIQDPTVTVTVTAVNSKRIFFIGQVAKPGPVPMTRQFSMLQAIAAAGGLSPYANSKHIYILRTVGGKEQKIFFNYNKALKSGDEQGIKLVPGDTVVVP